MKNKISLFLCILFLLIMAACTESENNYRDFSNSDTERTSVQMEQTGNSKLETESLSASAVTKEELAKEEERFNNLLASLNADSFSKIQINYVGGDNTRTYFSEDKMVIQQWVTLLKKMKITSCSYTVIAGSSFSINLFKDEQRIFIGAFALPYIYNSTDRTMNKIENLSEIQSEMNALLDKGIFKEID